jgi:hypothetical protein
VNLRQLAVEPVHLVGGGGGEEAIALDTTASARPHRQQGEVALLQLELGWRRSAKYSMLWGFSRFIDRR